MMQDFSLEVLINVIGKRNICWILLFSDAVLSIVGTGKLRWKTLYIVAKGLNSIFYAPPCDKILRGYSSARPFIFSLCYVIFEWHLNIQRLEILNIFQWLRLNVLISKSDFPPQIFFKQTSIKEIHLKSVTHKFSLINSLQIIHQMQANNKSYCERESFF